jgi:hypothetical protein
MKTAIGLNPLPGNGFTINHCPAPVNDKRHHIVGIFSEL